MKTRAFFYDPMRRAKWTLWMLVIGSSLNACSGENQMQPREINAELSSDFELISSSLIYFGHQSVGGNIIAGLEDLQSQRGKDKIRIAELGSLDADEGHGILLHTKVGENEKPISKCTDFRRILDEELGGRVDIALFKFCYIDFDENTDVDKTFAAYKETMSDLKHRHPNTIFIHVTAPVRYSAGGFGVWIREMLGRPNRSKLANISRNEFNRRLRETFATDPVFDLEASVSTFPDGRRESFTVDGNRYYSMVRAYSDDGGHLNAVGRTYAAADFVHSIAEAIRQKDGDRVAGATH